MFTPQRKGWSLTPRTAERNGSVHSNPRGAGSILFGKGKSVAAADGALRPPPQNSLAENGADVGGGNGEVEVWKSFREAGLLDEVSLERKDREALLERIGKLESELYDYQYTMGLLLIEKKEWTLKNEEFQQGFVEAEEILKREQAAHLIAITEIEKREENLRKALDVEKQCVTELEKALHEMRAEHGEVKITSDHKLAEACSLMEKVEEKSLEVEAKLRSADARLAEISRKNSEVERKSQKLAIRETALHRELASLNAEKELHAEDLARQREELQAWERNLHEGQERLVESQSLLNQREKRANESDKVLMKKEKEIEALRETMAKTNSSLKEKEDYINIRLTALAAKEKEAELEMKNLQEKQQNLLAIEEKLNSRERVEIQKLLDDQKSVLNSKMQEFEMDLGERRRSFDEELTKKLTSVEEKDNEINHKEEKLLKRELELENKLEKLKDDKKDLDMKAKALKKWETDLKVEGKELQEKNKKLEGDNEHLLIMKEEFEAERKSIEAEKIYLLTEHEHLKVTEQQRAEYAQLQSKLKQEIEDCRILKEALAKQHEDLRQDRDNFEREWEVLDEKRAALAVDEKQVNGEKERLEKWKHDEELRLESEWQATRDEIQRELDDLRLKKEAFEGSMAHEKSEVLDMIQRERADMAREHDLRKHEIEINMQKKLEELENQYQTKELELNEKRTTELNHIKSLRDLAASETQKVKLEQNRLEREKQEYLTQREKLEQDQLEIQNDIETLRTLSRNLKEQREEFIKEREHFLSAIEHFKICKNCGVSITEFVPPVLRPLHEIADPGNALLPSLADGYLEDHFKVSKADVSPLGNGSQSGTSGGRMSWLKSCTRKIFNFSPGKRVEDSNNTQAESSALLGLKLDEGALDDKEDDSFVPQNNPDDRVGVAEVSEGFDTVSKEPDISLGMCNNSGDEQRTESGNVFVERESGHADPLHDGQNESEIGSLSPLPEEGSQPQVSKKNVQRGGRRGRPKVIKRTRSVQAVVEESISFLKETSGKDGHGETKDSLPNNEGSLGDSVHTDRRNTSLGKKRQFAQTSETMTNDMDADSEAHSESVSIGGRRKRRQTVAAGAQAAGDKRYNFRRSTIAGTTSAAQAVSNQTKGKKTKNHPDLPVNDQSQGVPEEGEGASNHELSGAHPVDLARENDRDVHMLQRCATESIVEVNELSSQKALQVETEIRQVDNNMEFSEESGEVGEVNGAGTTSYLAAEQEEYETEEGEGNYDDESDSEKHNASMGKKLWNFFTT